MRTKKLIVGSIGILLLAILILPNIAEFNVRAEVTPNDTVSSNSAVSSVLSTKPTPLTTNDIAKAWPNLPSAKQIYDSGVCSIVNLNTFGKTVSMNATTGLPATTGINENSPSYINASSVVANCTSTTLNYQTGQYVYNLPTIWLQYNSTIWVQVPYDALQTSVQPYATAISQVTNQAPSNSPMVSSTTWSIGEYDNPQDITGSYPVEGAVSYGEWTKNSFGAESADYLGTDVLSVYTNDNLWIQAIMQVTPSGLSLYYNIWNFNTHTYSVPSQPITVPGSPNLNQLYSLFIQYSGNNWELFWNQINFYQFQDTNPGERIVTGAQSNVVIESNDITQSDFTGYSTTFGGTYLYNGNTYYLPAIGFLYNNNWGPINSGNTAPAAYTYVGGNSLAGWTPGPGGTGQGPPPNWSGTTIGLTPLQREQFKVGIGQPAGSEGSLIWSKGTVP